MRHPDICGAIRAKSLALWETFQKRSHRRRLFRSVHAPKGVYADYLNVQLRRTLKKRHAPIPTNTRYLVARLTQCRPPSASTSVLCIGCRNRRELDYLREQGYDPVVGVDLFSECPDIRIMDMHAMSFHAHTFDVVYASHSFEHSYDPGRAAAEICRVLRPGGVVCIEVPVHYETRDADLHDYGSADGIVSIFREFIEEVLYQEDSPPDSPTNHLPEAIARVVFRVRSG